MDGSFDAVLDRYEARRRRERAGGDEEHMLAVGAETGRLLNILARSLTAPKVLELGTSYGYSGLWLAEAARATGGRVITIELAPRKSAYASEQARAAGLGDWIEHRVGDAVAMIGALPGKFDMVFVDLWKDLYLPCLEAFYPRLAPGAIVVADNMIHPGSAGCRAYGARIRCLPGITSVLLPVGCGLEVSRYQPD
jgi:predicted O-methyltransferase YrrM